MSDAVRVVAVVVPARDEQELLPACLASITQACLRLTVPTRTVLVADHCTDATAGIAAAAGARVVRCEGDPTAGVGAARAAGCAYALDMLGLVPAREVWLAHTDADTVVPPDWLVAQLALAAPGADVVAGSVALASAGSEGFRDRWHRAYQATAADAYPHVHGANLGVRADAYLDAGGFAPVPAHEDVGLVARLEAAGRKVHYTEQPRVVTSARLCARAPAGFAGDLRTLL